MAKISRKAMTGEFDTRRRHGVDVAAHKALASKFEAALKKRASFTEMLTAARDQGEALREAIEYTQRLVEAAIAESKKAGSVNTDTDAADAKAILAGVHAGTIETFPGEIVGRLVDGENPVRIFREFRDMTGEELAKAVGISRPYLTQIETGKREAMFPVMVKIARALDVSLDLLAPAPEERETV